MQLDKLTLKSQEALQAAQRLARESSHQEMDGEHLLLALLGQAESLVPELLARIGVPPAKLQPDLEKELARPLKRAIQEHLLDPLATKLLAGEFKSGDKIKVST